MARPSHPNRDSDVKCTMFTARKQLSLGLLLGLAIMVWLTVQAGLPLILDLLGRLDWVELATICLLQTVSLAICGAAWRIFTGETGVLACTAARCIRDGASSLLSVVPGLGEAAGARALALLGARGRIAAASTVMDVAAGSLSQATFTLLGVAALWAAGSGGHGLGLAIAVVTALPFVAVYGLLRHKGASAMAGKLVRRIARATGLADRVKGSGLGRSLSELSQDRGRIAASTLLHLLAWMIGVAQVWVAAEALGHPLSPAGALAITSLVAAARVAFVIVPWGVGVQEAGFVVFGRLLGMDEVTAIALSLVVRGRETLLAVPWLRVWAALEAREFRAKAGREVPAAAP